MATYKSEFLHTLESRGFISQISEPASELDELAHSSTVTAYIGFDCTAPSLHVGSLLPIMMLYWLQQTGHRPIALMGGGTTRVGDPSGKDESRRLISEDQIAQNLRGIRNVFSNYLRFENESPAFGHRQQPHMAWQSNVPQLHYAIMENNAHWLDKLNYINFLREVGSQFSINRMLTFDSVKLRLERQQELSFLEFNYMILQAYDFIELFQRYNCVLQMGGSDQWGNIVNGIELGRRIVRTKLFGLTSPLVTTATGAKMGKTASGAVWLDPRMTNPFEFRQFWRNTADDDVIRFLKLFTTVPLAEISHFAGVKGEELNEAKEMLAEEVTTRIHGENVARSLAEMARRPTELGSFSEGLPVLNVRIGDGILSANTELGFSSSNTQARQFIKDGAIHLGNHRISDPNYKFGPQDFNEQGQVLLRMGTRKRAILKLVE